MRSSSRFRVVHRTGERRHVGAVTVVRAPGPAGPPEVGIVAGRRVGNAVRRNRAKRRLREAMARVPLATGTTYVVVAGPGVVEAEFSRLVDWVRRAVGGETEERE